MIFWNEKKYHQNTKNQAKFDWIWKNVFVEQCGAVHAKVLQLLYNLINTFVHKNIRCPVDTRKKIEKNKKYVWKCAKFCNFAKKKSKFWRFLFFPKIVFFDGIIFCESKIRTTKKSKTSKFWFFSLQKCEITSKCHHFQTFFHFFKIPVVRNQSCQIGTFRRNARYLKNRNKIKKQMILYWNQSKKILFSIFFKMHFWMKGTTSSSGTLIEYGYTVTPLHWIGSG